MEPYKIVNKSNYFYKIIDQDGTEIAEGTYIELTNIIDKLNTAYKNGMKKGIWWFAWWKDGVQYCGAGVKTLKEALNEVEDGSIY